MRWLNSECTLELDDQTLKTTLQSSLVDGSSLYASLSIGKFGDLSLPLSDNTLEGRLRLGVIDLNLSGTVWKPYIDGTISLQEGGLSFPDLGINFSDIALNVQGD